MDAYFDVDYTVAFKPIPTELADKPSTINIPRTSNVYNEIIYYTVLYAIGNNSKQAEFYNAVVDTLIKLLLYKSSDDEVEFLNQCSRHVKIAQNVDVKCIPCSQNDASVEVYIVPTFEKIISMFTNSTTFNEDILKQIDRKYVENGGISANVIRSQKLEDDGYRKGADIAALEIAMKQVTSNKLYLTSPENVAAAIWDLKYPVLDETSFNWLLADYNNTQDCMKVICASFNRASAPNIRSRIVFHVNRAVSIGVLNRGTSDRMFKMPRGKDSVQKTQCIYAAVSARIPPIQKIK